MVVKGKIILKDAMAWKIAASRFWQNIVSRSKQLLKPVEFSGIMLSAAHTVSNVILIYSNTV